MSKDIAHIVVHDLRDWTSDKHRTVDDHPFGGGAGMLLKVEPIFKAIEDLKSDHSEVWITDPAGEIITQNVLKKVSRSLLSENTHVIIIVGHYEGVDYRVIKHLVDWRFSIGSYILSGGELPTLVLIDGLLRLIPGVLGNPQSNKDESFENDMLEYPQYTRPAEFNRWKVPEVLLSGNHAEIEKWRLEHKKQVN
jgi:tRNA (guanine37-N1)-methyltransferase